EGGPRTKGRPRRRGARSEEGNARRRRQDEEAGQAADADAVARRRARQGPGARRAEGRARQERREAPPVAAQGHEVGMARPLGPGRPDDAVGRLIALALEEDVGPGDRTAEACVPAAARGSALIFAKETLVVSGISAAARVFRALDPTCELEGLRGEGDAAAAG